MKNGYLKKMEEILLGENDILTVFHRLFINYKGEKQAAIILTKYSNLAHAS